MTVPSNQDDQEQNDWHGGADNWTVATDWSTGSVPGPDDNVTIQTGDPLVNSVVGPVNSVSDTSTLFIRQGGSLATTGDVTTTNFLGVDNQEFENPTGGSSLDVGGTLNNSGTLDIGAAGDLTAATTVTANALVNTGTINLDGSSSFEATLDVAGAAGTQAGAPGTLSGNINLSGEALLEFGSGFITSMATNSELRLDGTSAFVADAGTTTSNSALTGLASNAGSLTLLHGASIATTGDLATSDFLGVDNQQFENPTGGSSLDVGGTLNNSGTLDIGAAGDLTAATTVTANGLVNTGTINLDGSSSFEATLDVAGAAGTGTPGTLSGNVNLSGEALLEFGSGKIISIAANSELTLDGTSVFVADAGATSTNSALTGLASNAGSLTLLHGAAVSTTGDLVTSDFLGVDNPLFEDPTGGSSLAVAGTLNNSGTLAIGAGGNLTADTTVTVNGLVNTGTINLDGSSSFEATLDVVGAAGTGTPGTLSGNINLSGDALLEFGTGTITGIATNSELTLDGASVFVADAGAISKNSALTELANNAGSVTLLHGAAISTTGDLVTSDFLGVDNPLFEDPTGGSSLSVAGTLSNLGTLAIGAGGNLTADTTVTVNGLVNTGTINLDGSSSFEATLDVAGAAGTGTPGTLSGNFNLSGEALLEFGSGTISSIAANSELTLDGASVFVADAGATSTNSALTGLANNAGSVTLLHGASISATGDLSTTGFFGIDNPLFEDPTGGSSLAVAGTLDNSGTLAIGAGGNLTAATTVTANGFVNTGTINLDGSSTFEATLDVAGPVSTPGTLSGNVNLSGNALLEFGSGTITGIASNSELTLDGANVFVADAGNTSTNSALTGLANNAGSVTLLHGAAVSTTGDLVTSDFLGVDNPLFEDPTGGSSLAVAGTLSNSGTLAIGAGGNLTADTTVTANGLVNTGTINLDGSSSFEATLDVTGAAGTGTPGTLSGNVNLSGDALLEFGSGTISSIAANSELTLAGANAFVADAGATSSDSALSGLATNNGTLNVLNGAVFSSDADLTNVGLTTVDDGFGEGGSTFSVDGTFTNTGTLDIGYGFGGGLSADDLFAASAISNAGTINITGNTVGNGAAGHRATVSISGPAGLGADGVISGTVSLTGVSLLDFGSGEIHEIAKSAQLTLDGGGAGDVALVADASDTSSNSALTGLTENDGSFFIGTGEVLDTTGPLDNTGVFGVDDGFGSGGSTVTIGGALTNSGTFSQGYGFGGGLGANDFVSVSSIANTGTLDITGNGVGNQAAGHVATFSVSSAAGFGSAGILTGTVNLSGLAVLQFSSGQITTIASGAKLTIDGAGAGNAALIADASDTSRNSALTGLSEIDGAFFIGTGEVLDTTGPLDNTGQLGVDDGFGSGGSTVDIGGTFTNSGTFSLGYGFGGGLGADDFVTVSSLVNTGTFYITGNGVGNQAAGHKATFSVLGAAGFGSAGILTGTVNLSGISVLQFGSGQITTIASGAQLSLDGAGAGNVALVADESADTSNSALEGLVENDGNLSLADAEVVSTSGDFSNTGTLGVDAGTGGGSHLALGGVLTNTGRVFVGNTSVGIATTLSTSGLVNSNAISIAGSGSNVGSLLVDGDIDNSGSINASDATIKASGSLAGSGTITLNNGSILDVGTTNSSTVTFGSGASTLKIESPTEFGGTISGLAVGDVIDLAGVSAESAKIDGSTLDVEETNGNKLSFAISNVEADTGFLLQNDGAGGTNLVLAPAILTPPTISAAGSVTVTGNTPSSLGTLTVADIDPVASPLTLALTVGKGVLDANQTGNGTVLGDGTNSLTLTGTTAEINSELASLSYVGVAVPGQTGTTIADALSITATDAVGESASTSVAITLDQAIDTGPSITAPATISAKAGVTSVLNGISVSDPYATSIGAIDSVTINLPGAVINATIPTSMTTNVSVTGEGTGSLTLTGTPDALNKVLLGNVSATVSSTTTSGTASVDHSSGTYDFVDFTKTNNIQSALLAQFPTGVITANNALQTPFDITSDANGNNFNDNEGASLTIPVNIPPANVEPGGGGIEEVDMLISAFNPPVGAAIETVEFDGVDGSNNAVREVFTLVDGTTVRDVFQTTNPNIATTIDTSAAAPAALPAFTFTNITGGATVNGAASGTAENGATGTYNIDEQRFVLDPDFQTASLQKIIITPEGGGGTPLLFGVTLRETPSVLDAGETGDQFDERVKMILDPDPDDDDDDNGDGDGGDNSVFPPPPPDIPPSTDGGPNGDGNGHNGGPGNGPGARGDVHITTYDGLYYNFQAEGEFVLTKSLAPSDNFEVQVRLQPWFTSASVSVITQAGIQVGSDKVTFDPTRSNLVWIDGVASNALTGPNSSVALNGGVLLQVTSNQYEIVLNTGETVTVVNQGNYLDVTPTLPANATANSVAGLLGADAGQANDFTLADGTVLKQPLTSSDLYGTFANSWRITDADSILNYGAGQTTATFTDVDFPTDAISLADLPANVVAAAAAIVAAAGITDPTVAQGAELDYLATGDLAFVTGDATGSTSTPVSQAAIAQVQSTQPTLPAIGVVANAASFAASSSGSTSVTFDIYLTGAATDATTVDYAVIAPNANSIGGTVFNGLPSGQVVIPQGGTTAQVTIDVPAGALGTADSGTLDLQITSPGGNPIFGGTAEATLVSQNAPTIDNITFSPPADVLGIGATVQVRLTFDEPITVSGKPSLALNDGGVATYVGSGAGATQTLIFSYTVAAGDATPAMDGLQVTGLNLNGGTITNAAGTDASLTLGGGLLVGPMIDTSAPTISGTVAGQTTLQEAPVTPFSGVSIADGNVNDTDALTITIGGSGGTLSGTGLIAGGNGVYALTGTAADITKDLDALVFTPSAGAPNSQSTSTLTLSDTSHSFAVPTVDATTTVTDTNVSAVPTITGTVAGQTTTSEKPVTPFSTVTIADANGNATDTLTITIGGSGGTLADGAGFSGLSAGGPAGVYTLAGTADAITKELDALVFTPAGGAPNASLTSTFSLSDVSGASATPSVDNTTSVIDKDPAVAPIISNKAGAVAAGSETPFAGFSILDPNSGTTDTLAIQLSSGTLVDGLGFSGLVQTSTPGLYKLTGTASAITAELDALVFQPAGTSTNVPTTNITLTDTTTANTSASTSLSLQGFGNSDSTVGLTGSGNEVVGGNGDNTISGGAGNNAVTVGNGKNMITPSGTNNTITAGSGFDYVNVLGGTTVTLGNGSYNKIQASGLNNVITVGSGTNLITSFNGSDKITANGGHDTMSLAGTGIQVNILGSAVTNISDVGHALQVDVGSSTQVDTIGGLGGDASWLLDFTNGAGGFSSVGSVMNALQSDGHGGTSLSLGSTGSLDFVNLAQNQIHASNFKVGSGGLA